MSWIVRRTQSPQNPLVPWPMPMRWRPLSGRQALPTLLGLALLLSPALTVAGDPPISTAFPGTNGQIAFASDRMDPAGDIWVMNDDGTAQTRLTTSSQIEAMPRWSADGAQIVYMRNNTIYVMDANGANQTQIVTSSGDDEVPAWSPDGTQIVFRSTRDGNAEIYIANADGTAQTRLTNNGANDTNPEWSPDGTQIAFQSDRDGNFEIYVMDADGNNQTRLTTAAGNDTWPSWSPGGTQITFQSTRDGNNEVYVMTSAGASQTNVTNNVANDQSPRFSPDGQSIAFVTHRDGNAEVYSMDATGGNEVNLTNSALGTLSDYQPDWQPTAPFPPSNPGPIVFATDRDGNTEIYVMETNGSSPTRLTNDAAIDDFANWNSDASKLAFESDRDGDDEIYVMNANGTGVVQLTTNTDVDQMPAWSPDNTQIAFRTDRDGHAEIYVMNADGSSQTNISNAGGLDSNPHWSPDGSSIAFHTSRDGNFEIYSMLSNGNNQTNLTNNGASDQSPDWSPDGTKIVFQSTRDGNSEIYVMDANGANPTRLTNHAAFDFGPKWSPDGTQITFTSTRDGNTEVYVMNADGSGQTNISNNGGSDIVYDWGGAVTPPPNGDVCVTYRDDDDSMEDFASTDFQDDWMNKNVNVSVDHASLAKAKIWIYGQPFNYPNETWSNREDHLLWVNGSANAIQFDVGLEWAYNDSVYQWVSLDVPAYWFNVGDNDIRITENGPHGSWIHNNLRVGIDTDTDVDRSSWFGNGELCGNPASCAGELMIYLEVCTDSSTSVEEPLPRFAHNLTVSPNPFNPRTTVQLTTSRPGMAHIAVFDLRGRQVRNLSSRFMEAGTQQVVWDGRDDSGTHVASGVYFVRAFTVDGVAVRKATLLK